MTERKTDEIEAVLKAADMYDEWVDELTDKFLDGMPSYSEEDSYRIENLMHSHRQIAEMMLEAAGSDIRIHMTVKEIKPRKTARHESSELFHDKINGAIAEAVALCGEDDVEPTRMNVLKRWPYEWCPSMAHLKSWTCGTRSWCEWHVDGRADRSPDKPGVLVWAGSGVPDE